MHPLHPTPSLHYIPQSPNHPPIQSPSPPPRHIPVPREAQHPFPRPPIPRLHHHDLAPRRRPAQRGAHRVIPGEGQQALEAAGGLVDRDGCVACDAREPEPGALVLAPELEVEEAGALFCVM